MPSGGFQLDQPLRRDHLWPRTRSPSSEPPTSFAPPGKKRRKEKKRLPIKGTLATTSCGVHVHGLHTTRFGSPLLGAEAVKVCMLLERCCAPRSRVTTEDGRGVHTLSGRGLRSLKAPGRPPLACQGAELLHARLAACQDRLAVPLTCSAPDRHSSLSGSPDSGREPHPSGGLRSDARTSSAGVRQSILPKAHSALARSSKRRGRARGSAKQRAKVPREARSRDFHGNRFVVTCIPHIHKL